MLGVWISDPKQPQSLKPEVIGDDNKEVRTVVLVDRPHGMQRFWQVTENRSVRFPKLGIFVRPPWIQARALRATLRALRRGLWCGLNAAYILATGYPGPPGFKGKRRLDTDCRVARPREPYLRADADDVRTYGSHGMHVGSRPHKKLSVGRLLGRSSACWVIAHRVGFRSLASGVGLASWDPAFIAGEQI